MLSRRVLLTGGLCLFCIASGPRPAEGQAVAFLRGDANADGQVSISDALMSRRFLFNGEIAPSCLDAADADDSAYLDLTDVVYTLNALFLGGAGIPAPFPEAGPDPTPPSKMGCESYQVVEPIETRENLVRIGEISASPGQSVSIPVYLTSSVEIEAFQLVVRYDPALFTPAANKAGVDFTGTRWDGGIPNRMGFVSQRAYPEAGFFVTGVVGSLTGFNEQEEPFLPFPPFPAGEDQVLFHLQGKVSGDAVPGTTIILEPTNGSDGAGVLPPYFLRNELTHQGEARFISVVPRTEAGALAIVSDIGFFIRGDANSDQVVDISDPLYTLNHLFLGGAAPKCQDAADADDSGNLDLTDGVVVLEQLFLGSGRIADPYPLAGADPTIDGLASCAQN